jgi:hypothetical protein
MRPEPSSHASPRCTLLRVIAGVLALLAAPTAWRDLSGMLRGRFDPLLAVFAVCTTLFVLLAGWFALRGHVTASRTRIKLVLTTGFVVGGVGFAIGFLGPMLWAPGANQGPMLGIFITGPLGFVAGVLGGWIYARLRASPLSARS